MPGIEADLTAAGTVPELHRFPFSSHFHGNLKALKDTPFSMLLIGLSAIRWG